jgi:transposase
VASVLTQLQTTIEALDQQIGSLDAEIAQVLADGAWSASATLLQTIPGIGPVTASWFLVTTLNGTLGRNAEEVSAYVGLAPMPHESGTRVRGRARIGHDGSGHLRTALYLATLSAAQSNPVIKAFYDRLRDAGKPHKVARCAAARKLLHLAWAVVTKQQPFDLKYRSQATRAALATSAA